VIRAGPAQAVLELLWRQESPHGSGGSGEQVVCLLADLPASLHGDRPTSQVGWTGLGIAPVSRAIAWPDTEPAIAGVNTYGLSGTFVHVLVGEPVS
jgi:hypothetical protein